MTGTTNAEDRGQIETTETSLTIRRTFDALHERVYRAFMDPKQLEQWFAPRDMTSQVHTLEPMPDGALAVSFLDGKNRIDVEGTFLEVVENKRIVHTWQYPGEEESRVTYEFRDVDDGTEVVLTHENVSAYRDLTDHENVDGYVEGWSNALENLGEVVIHE